MTAPTFLTALIARLASSVTPGSADAHAANAIIRQLQGCGSLSDLALVHAWALHTIETSQPDFVIGPKEDPYVHRWWILGRDEAKPNLYLHKFFRSDDDRALHCHPWPNASWLLDGAYDEVLFDGPTPSDDGNPRELPPLKSVQRVAGDFIVRPAGTLAHRIALLPLDAGKREQPAITVFSTGPKEREWGFHCPQNWRHHSEYVEYFGVGNDVGRGCD